MKALTTRRFTRQFSKVRHEPVTVTDRGDVIGVWTPAPKKLKVVNFAERVREDFKKPLPFTIASLLKEKKR